MTSPKSKPVKVPSTPHGRASAAAEIERLTPRSRALHEQARRVTPGGLSHNARFHAPYPLYFAKARGSRIWDVDGREYIDLWMAHYDAILGHAPKEVIAPLKEVMEDGLHIGLAIEGEVRLAERVCRLVPSSERVRFCTSGTEATMYAVRLARAFTGRNTILKMVGGWHGANTDLMVDVFPPRYGIPEGRGLPPELTRCTKSCQYNDEADTARAMNEIGADLAAVILEPTLGAGGMIPAEKRYLEFLREETRKHGALLIFDEVITGFRFAPGGAQAHFGVTPDLTTLGKILGGGMTIGAIAGRADVLEPSSILRKSLPKEERVIVGGGTYSCNPMSMAAGMVTLDILSTREKQIYPVLEKRNRRMAEGITKEFAARGIPVEVTAPASLHAVHFTKEQGLPVRNMAEILSNTYPDKQHELADRLRIHGVFQFHAGALSIEHSEADVDVIIAAYAKCADEMAEGRG